MSCWTRRRRSSCSSSPSLPGAAIADGTGRTAAGREQGCVRADVALAVHLMVSCCMFLHSCEINHDSLVSKGCLRRLTLSRNASIPLNH